MKTKKTPVRPSIREVAKRAGVSVATVSRVLNDMPRVNPQTRARIQSVLASMNYVRHGAARALSSRRSQTIGLIVPLLGPAVFSEAMQAIEKRMQEHKYYVLTAGSGYDPDKEFDVARAMVERGVDGLVLVGSTHLPALYALLEQAGIPAVQTFALDPDSRLPCVGFDNYTPAYELTAHLIDLGHREFAVMHGGLKSNDRITSRFDGIMDCLRKNGIKPDARLVVEVGHTISEGRRGLEALVRTGHRFTALACSGDIIAVGALVEARHLGIAVPGQVSITGFHDLDLASHTDPPLTTVHAPISEMGRMAADFLIARIAGKNPPAMRALPTSIVLRKSVGPAPRRQG
jgi:LacI family transcriptional regulator